MEESRRGFTAFMAAGLTLAVVVGLLVWKLSESNVQMSPRGTEFAGQPVSTTEESGESGTRTHAASSDSSPTVIASEQIDTPAGQQVNTGTPAGGQSVYDPLAPRGANLDGPRGGANETSYYRPTNAAPLTATPPGGATPNSPQPAPRDNTDWENAPESAGDPAEPQRPAAPQRTPAAVVPENQQEPVSRRVESGATPPEAVPSPSPTRADQVQDTQNRRPEDPFSASTRDAQPAQNPVAER